ncbi:MAG: HAMP domain-containing histidine kinase [Lewinella sp.]|nr:HAMP domain-containing histidine kinase [Lewinella sp.]
MDIYTRKSRWKIYLALVGLAIVVISILYTGYLARRLALVEQNNVRFYVMAQEDINDMDDEAFEYCDPTLQLEILTSNTTIPVLITNERGGIDWYANWPDSTDSFLQQQLDRLKDAGVEPIPSAFGTNIYFDESTVLKQLRFFPVVQFLLIGAFIVFGYVGFNSARRAEQNRVWVGMAKETAHQLGTPISAILAWIEHLRLIRPDDGEVLEVLDELNNDIGRLDLIADRFSKIGSAPKLDTVNIYTELDACRRYMERRAPRKVQFNFPEAEAGELNVSINPHLFDWVIENLLRNALDAMDGQGEISADVYEDAQNVFIDLTDTGKGIPSGKHKTVFRPGYTTKRRGWGLGLSLAKRIIEQYHSGKIFVKRSEEGKGTTFTISLPKGSGS